MKYPRRPHPYPALFLALLCLFPLKSAKAQERLQAIQQRGELIIATDGTYPPFEFKESNKLQGFDIEIGDAIAQELGVKAKWQNLEWTGVLASLESGKCDLVLSGVTITDERKRKGYLFSRPYFLSGQTFARRKGDTRIQTINDLKGKKVSVQVGTTGQFALEAIGLPKQTLMKFDALQDGCLDVRNGASDAVVADLPALKELLRKNFPELEIVGGIFKEENVGVTAWRTETPLMQAVNDALAKIMVDGRYARAYNTWLREPLTTKHLAGLERVLKEGSLSGESTLPNTTTTPTNSPTNSPPSPTGSALRIRWDLLAEATPLLAAGAKITLFLTLLTLLIGTPAGLAIALCRLSRFPALRAIALTYIEIIRGTPLLMQIYVIYFVLPAIGLQFSPIAAGVLALSVNAAAYIAEIFRGGIESIETGQMEAATALGMDYAAAMRWVVLPQTFRRVLPPLTNEAIALLKDSSLVSVVAVSELMRVGKEFASNSGSAMTIYLTVAAFYLLLTLPLTYLARRLEIRWQPISRQPAKGA